MKQQNILMLFYNTFRTMSLRGVAPRATTTPALAPGASEQSSYRRGDCAATAPRRRFVGKFALLAMTLTLVSCTPANSTIPTQTHVATDSPPPTQTIVWFPPSATSTLQTFPTYTATPEMSPGIGPVTLTDDFADDSPWDTAVSDQGSAILSRSRLTLAVQPGIQLASLRRDSTFGNFYAEITAHTSLCRAQDKYGILVRSVGSSFYRVVLSCNGFIHVERIKNGTKLIIYEAVPSGDAPLGAPGEVRIGIWAVGGEMRLFLNGRFQFSITDKSFPNGALGVFVRSMGDTPVTVSFSDLTVYDVEYVFPTRTPSP